MRFASHSAALCTYIFLLMILAAVVGACRTSPKADVKTSPTITTATPAGATPESRVVAERPLLEGLIENVSIYPVPNHDGDSAVSLVVSVGNSGSPSIVQGWSLEVNSPGRRVPTGLEPVHVNGLVDMPGTNNSKVDLGKEDLVLKTGHTPVAKGVRVKGILTFVLPGISGSALENNSTKLILHFKDAQGNSYHTPRSVIGGKVAGEVRSKV